VFRAIRLLPSLPLFHSLTLICRFQGFPTTAALIFRRTRFRFLRKIFISQKKIFRPTIFCKIVKLPRLNIKVSNDFKTLIEFLDGFEPEVSGRSQPQPYKEDAAKLLRFATGACDEDERTEVCEMLRIHPAWIRWVADRVRMARTVKVGP
jgi:hypothetical protein